MNTIETYFKWLHACLWSGPVKEEKEDITLEIQTPANTLQVTVSPVPGTSKSYFTIEEMIASATAKKLKIDNTPSEEIKKHLQEVIDFLNPLREAWGSAIVINSGYRCPALNRAVNGAPTSVHQIGYAADCRPANGKQDEFEKFVVNYLKDKNFDQCIKERSKNSRWVHIGLYNNAHQQRKQIKYMNV